MRVSLFICHEDIYADGIKYPFDNAITNRLIILGRIEQVQNASRTAHQVAYRNIPPLIIKTKDTLISYH
jgi:hypothetical protein